MIIEKNKFGNFHLLKCSGGNTSDAILTELSNYAIEEGLATSEHTSAILEREAQYPTGLLAKIGVAIPHADQAYTKVGSIVIALLEQPATFKAMGGAGEVPVEIVFMLLVDKPENQVKVLGNIVDLIQSESAIQALKGSEANKILSDKFKDLI